MPRLRLFIILGGLVASLAVAAGVLAAAGVFDDSDSSDETTSAGLASAKPTVTPSATAVADAPDGVPQELWVRLQALPEKLRSDLLSRLRAGSIALNQIETVIQQYADRNQSVRVGTVVDTTGSTLSLEVYTTGEQAEVALNDETVLRRGNDDIEAADLRPNELVLVLSRDGGETAFAVEAFGVSPP
jgi:hypothetical protein